MKKILPLILLVMTVLSVAIFTIGCANSGKTSLLGTVKNVIVGDDYEAAGETLGSVGVTAYTILKGNPKYDKYTSKMEELYAALEKADGGVTAGSVNELALEVAQVALTAKYGYAKASLITTGIRVGGAVADRIIARKVDEVAAEQFLKGFKTGVDKALADLPEDAFVETEKTEEKAFECDGGNCDIVVTDRSVKKQRAIAEQLVEEKWVKKSDAPREGMAESDYKNVKDFIERCKVLKKFGVKTTDLYIKRFKCKTVKGDDGKDVKSLESIEFKMIVRDEETGKAEEFDVFCVSCQDVPEIEDMK
jgi:hypothetical protein